MSGDMNERVTAVHHVSAEPRQAVDHPINRALVARNQRAGQHDGVTLSQLDHRMFPVRHPGQRRQRLALRARRDDDDLLWAVVVDLALIDQGIAWDFEIAEVPGNGHVAHHRAADVDHLAAMSDGRVQDLLHAVHMGGETGHDYALPATRQHSLKGRPDISLGCGEAGHLRISRVDHEQVDALFTEPGESAQVSDSAIQRQLIHLEVAGVQDQSGRGSYGNGQRIGNGVVDCNELDTRTCRR